MAFFKNILKRNTSADKEAVSKKTEPVSHIVTPDTKDTAKEYLGQKETQKAPLNILRSAHITEKNSRAAINNTYIFVVSPHANKQDVQHAVHARYGVQVERVRMILLPGKERKRGRQIGWKAGIKKAMVTIKEGQTIEIQ